MTTFTEKPTAITPNRELQSDEYFNETNHLIYCSKCNTPRQCRHELQGKVLIPSIRCKCQQEIFEQEEAQRKLHEKQMEIEHLKTSGLQDKSLYDYTFAKDNGSNPEMKLAHNYVSNWEETKANASGLLICTHTIRLRRYGHGRSFLTLYCLNCSRGFFCASPDGFGRHTGSRVPRRWYSGLPMPMWCVSAPTRWYRGTFCPGGRR